MTERKIWAGNEHIHVSKWKIGQIVDYVELAPKEPIIPPGLPCWHVLSVAPQQEVQVGERLVQAGFRSRAFSVWKREFTGRVDQRGRRETVDKQRPMFPGYVFCDLRPGHHDFNKARGVKGARDFLRSTDKWPVTVKEELVFALEKLESDKKIAYFDSLKPKPKRRNDLRVGQPVRILDGIFADFIAKVDRLNANGRVRLLLKFLGGETETWVDGNQLEIA